VMTAIAKHFLSVCCNLKATAERLRNDREVTLQPLSSDYIITAL
jgi:hypothetical protein